MANGSISPQLSPIFSKLRAIERTKIFNTRLQQFEKAAPELYDFHLQYRLPYSVISFTWLDCTTEFLNAFPQHKEELNYYFDQPLVFIVGDLREEDKGDGLLRVITANIPLPADELNDDDDDRSSDEDINVEESDVGAGASGSSSSIGGSLQEIQSGGVDAVQEASHIRHQGSTSALDSQPQNTHLLATLSDNGAIYLFDLNELYAKGSEEDAESGCLRLQFDGHRRTGYSLCWSKAQLGLLASGAMDKCVHLWDVGSQRSQAVASYTGHSSPVTSVRCHPTDGNWIAAADDSGYLYHWDRRSSGKHTPVMQKRVHSSDICCLQWHPNPAINFLATASEDMSLKVFDARNFNCPLFNLKHEGGVNSVSWHPQRAHVLASGSLMPDATVSLWDVTTYDATQRESSAFTPHKLFQDGLLMDNVSDIKWHDTRPDVIGVLTEDGYMSIYKPQADMYKRCEGPP